MKERNKYKINGNIEAYKDLRKKVSRLIENAKKETYQSKIEEGLSDPRSIWKLFKELRANGKGSKDDPNINLKLGYRLVANESDLTEIFNSYFINVAPNLKETSIPSDFEIINNYVQSKVRTNTEFQFSFGK